MSKSKVPTLPPHSSRAVIIAFRDKVRTYARQEFEQGATPEQVYQNVSAGGQLWAIRNSIDAEYLDYLGVPRKKARMTSMIAGMACYFVLAGFAPPWIPVLRYGIPVFVAMIFARGVEVFVTNHMRKKWEQHKRAGV